MKPKSQEKSEIGKKKSWLTLSLILAIIKSINYVPVPGGVNTGYVAREGAAAG
jgi:hypothetical protein